MKWRHAGKKLRAFFFGQQTLSHQKYYQLGQRKVERSENSPTKKCVFPPSILEKRNTDLSLLGQIPHRIEIKDIFICYIHTSNDKVFRSLTWLKISNLNLTFNPTQRIKVDEPIQC